MGEGTLGIEQFTSRHPLAYVHIAYAVVWGLHFGYALWIGLQWRKTSRP